MKYQLSITTTFCAAHKLPKHEGKCKRLHGHTWKVEATFEGFPDYDTGMVADFAELKEAVNLTIRLLDHQNLNEIFRFAEPTAEIIATHIYKAVAKRCKYNDYTLTEVSVWESPDCKVTVSLPRKEG